MNDIIEAVAQWLRAGERLALATVINVDGSAPRDAVRSFYSPGIDAMFVGNFLLEK